MSMRKYLDRTNDLPIISIQQKNSSTLLLEHDSCDTFNALDLSLNCYLCDFTKYDQRDTSMTFDTSAKKLA